MRGNTANISGQSCISTSHKNLTYVASSPASLLACSALAARGSARPKMRMLPPILASPSRPFAGVATAAGARRRCSRIHHQRFQVGFARKQRPYSRSIAWALTRIRASRATREVHSVSSTKAISPNNDADKQESYVHWPIEKQKTR